MDTLLDVLGAILSDREQLKFFVYLWLIVWGIGVFANHMTWKRIRQASSYVGITLLLFNVAMSYNLKTISQPTTSTTDVTLAMSLLTYISVVGGLMSALGINSYSRQQRGFLYRCITNALRVSAEFVEKRTNPVTMLQGLADKFEARAKEANPATKLTTILEGIQNGET